MSSFTQTTQDHRTSSKMPCNIELGLLAEMSRSTDKELAQECSDMINRAFQVQADCMALIERIKAGLIAEFEDKHVSALLEKQRLEDELKTLNLKSYEFQAESGRIAGRLQQAQNRLAEHGATKKAWIPALLLPATKLQWEVTLNELQAKVDSGRKETADLQMEVNAFNNDLATLANRIRTVTADALYYWNRLERLRGKSQVQHDAVTGLAS